MEKIRRKTTEGILFLCAMLLMTAIPDPVHGADKYSYADWCRSLNKVAEDLEKDHFYYSVNGAKGTYVKSKANRRVTNCAVYVSWSLQDLGILKKGQVFWIDKGGAIRGKNKHCITKNKKVRILHPNKKAAKAGLQKGDICGWSSHIHTAVYAGKDAKGNLLWYSAGRDGGVKKNGKWYFKGKKIKAKTRAKRYNGKISTVIRIKNLKKAGNTNGTKNSVQNPERNESENAMTMNAVEDVQTFPSVSDEAVTAEADSVEEDVVEEGIVEEEDSEPEEDVSTSGGYFQAGPGNEGALENLEDEGTDSEMETNGTDFEREETDPALLEAMPLDDWVNDQVVDLDAEEDESSEDSNDAVNTRNAGNSSDAEDTSDVGNARETADATGDPSEHEVTTPETGDEGLFLFLVVLALSGSGLIFLAHHRKPD